MFFSQLSDADRNIQTTLIDQINNDPRNPTLRFELAMEFASTGWIELGWEQLTLVPKLHDDYASVVFDTYSQAIQEDPNDWKAHFRLAFAYYFLEKRTMRLHHLNGFLIFSQRTYGAWP